MFKGFTQSRLSWGILLLSGIALELAALFFQYVMKLDPCIMCVYQRVAVLGLVLAGLVGLLAPTVWLVRVAAAAIWGISAGWGLKLAYELDQMQTNPNPFATCSFMPDFPKWMPLHEWLPSVFMPTGMCTDVPWTFLDVTMAQWMIVIFAGALAVLLLFLLPLLSRQR
ncbi:disulfide bond formation protein DsbB [Shewanella sp. A3A]|uniref:Disulfide bond formation protein B n=1 Tax=Shewanella electrica TaxID=515560 RepID=A0ABT2FTS3_9GAMM|nr:disulfide bond formation protein DsbB [Shewanella electrica]MCH1921393.1 disulfide bond formation protein DsbB [Shewanella ferrihydritica]MCH1927011.1 disulfide bond formation protein DsbB [Shewanella electrica]MCS4558634.1 disulfide bond formation protein DsbB [Shewanella electrica]